MSPEKCIVVVIRIIPCKRGKPTLYNKRKAADLDVIWRVFRSPPGSETRACAQRGNSGTWESRNASLLKHPEDEGYREIKSPGVHGSAFARERVRRETRIEEAGKVSGEDSEERTNLRRAFGSLSGT